MRNVSMSINEKTLVFKRDTPWFFNSYILLSSKIPYLACKI